MIKRLGVDTYFYKCDVTDIDSVKKTAESVRQDLGEVDILVNNAGIMNVKEFKDLSETDIRRTMDVNVMAHFWVCFTTYLHNSIHYHLLITCTYDVIQHTVTL